MCTKRDANITSQANPSDEVFVSSLTQIRKTRFDDFLRRNRIPNVLVVVPLKWLVRSFSFRNTRKFLRVFIDWSFRLHATLTRSPVPSFHCVVVGRCGAQKAGWCKWRRLRSVRRLMDAIVDPYSVRCSAIRQFDGGVDVHLMSHAHKLWVLYISYGGIAGTTTETVVNFAAP